MANSASDETIKIKNAAREAKDSFQSISAILATTAKTTKAAAEIQDRVNKSVKGQVDLADQLNVLEQEKQTYLQEYIKSGKIINESLVAQLDLAIDITKSKIEQKGLEEAIKDLAEGYKDELYDSLGTLGQMLKAGTTLGFAMEALKGTTAAIGGIFKNTIGFASELTKELGISGGEAARLGFQNLAPSAMFSRYSIEELNQATKDFVETMGTSAGLTNDLRNSMAELTKMGVGGAEAAKMAQSMESAGGSAVDMTTSIKEMAQDSGVLASGVFKDMASQQRLMVGMTEKEINLLAKKTIELHKQGVTLDDMHGIADSMMDIESTMKAQAKARVMLQGKLTQDQIAGMSAMTAAALEFQNTGDTSKLEEALKRTNMSAEEFNELGPRGQEIYAQAIGMTADKLSEVIQKQEQAKKIEESGALGKAAAAGLEMWERVPGGIKEATTGLITYMAQMMLMNKMQGKGTGLGNLNPFKKKGGGGGTPIETEVPGSDDVAPKAQGSEGGLKSLAEGLKAMGDGKVFAGIGAVALAGPAFIVALPSIPFLLFMGKVKLKALEENFTGLGKGLAQMPQGILGALTMAIAGPALALGMLAIPFLAFMSIPAIGPVIQANFTALAAGLAAFGNPATALFVLIGIGLLAALGAAMIPFAYSLSLLSPLVEAFGNIIVGVFGTIPPIITAVANGFATMFSSVTLENIGPLLLLGPALMGIAVGLAAVGFMGMPGMLVLTGLAAAAPALIQMATALNGFFGGSDDTENQSKESNTMGELLSEIKGLRQDLQAQPIMVNVDGKVVSKISRVQSRQSVSKQGYGG
jgi:hypothetical protein